MTHAMLITANRPDTGTVPSSHVSSAVSRNARLSTMTVRIPVRTGRPHLASRCNSHAATQPTAAPTSTPSTIETGICAKSSAETVPPCAMPTNAVNSTITNTSSNDAPARISCGMPLSVP